MSAVMNDWISRHQFTVEEFLLLAEAGMLAQDARVELIEGEIIDMAPIGSPHVGTVAQLFRLLLLAINDRATVLSQSTVRLDRFSAPQPDFAVVQRRADFYKSQHAVPADFLLAIEVSQTSLRYDRQVKIPLYARHGIPEVWTIDLNDKRIHFFRSPENETYTDVSSTDRPGIVTPVALPGVEIDLSDLFAT